MSRSNVSVVLAERPKPKIIPGKTFAKKVQPAPTEADLKDGEILAETLYIGLDPAMRGWLNVGGEILDLALARAKKHARFVMCGGISTYNASEVRGPKNINMVIAMSIRMQGFIVFDYIKEYAQARQDLAKWLEEGKIKRGETIVKGGLNVIEQTLVDLFNGVNKGKLLVEVKNPDSAKL
ncbi:hypothetical protein PpBr36_04816 [Pyricularia pennisetigena]|uniref:hypothetical protein n=1 Tax=Pyricularia pennisetigena TaxID=1578925 RepID=UPI00114EA6B7|nr:hypothetical protein PpBr36_04816 [Pyricularia pennisetigena]TLS27655.1 hypothetical protein PpBr36_04816 [Pyricularia pennisetigena]